MALRSIEDRSGDRRRSPCAEPDQRFTQASMRHASLPRSAGYCPTPGAGNRVGRTGTVPETVTCDQASGVSRHRPGVAVPAPRWRPYRLRRSSRRTVRRGQGNGRPQRCLAHVERRRSDGGSWSLGFPLVRQAPQLRLVRSRGQSVAPAPRRRPVLARDGVLHKSSDQPEELLPAEAPSQEPPWRRLPSPRVPSGSDRLGGGERAHGRK